MERWCRIFLLPNRAPNVNRKTETAGSRIPVLRSRFLVSGRINIPRTEYLVKAFRCADVWSGFRKLEDLNSGVDISAIGRMKLWLSFDTAV
jgi:hypothetical protein